MNRTTVTQQSKIAAFAPHVATHCSPPQPNSVVYGEVYAERGGAEALKLRPSLRCLPLTDTPQP